MAGAFDKAWEVVKFFGPDFFDPDKKAKRQATKGTECPLCGMPKREGDNLFILSDHEMCDCNGDGCEGCDCRG